jgi:outer membrane protein TolC
VDLYGVSFVDADGRDLLTEMHGKGVRLVGSGPMISALIEEIQGAAEMPTSSATKRLLSLLLLLSLLFAAGKLFAEEPAESLSLNKAIEIAKAHNRQLKIDRLDVESAKDDIAIAKTKRLPSLQTDVYGSGLLAPFSFEFEKGAFGTFPATGPIPSEDTKVEAEQTFSVLVTSQLKQPLSQLYRINMAIKAKEAAHGIAKEQVRKSEQEMLRDLRKAYYNLLQTSSSYRAKQASIASLTELHRVLTDRVKQEAALPSDELEVRVALAKAKQDSTVIANDLASQKEQFNLLLGRDPAAQFEVEGIPELEWREEDLGAARSSALANRPELRESELRIKAADYDRRNKKAEMYPEVGLFVSYYSPFNVEVVPKNIAAGGIQISWEPFDWGRKKRELHQKELVVEQAKVSDQHSRDAVLVEVGRAFRSLREKKDSAEIAQLNSESTQQRLRETTNRFKENTALLKDVLDAQSKLADAQHQQYQAALAYWNAKAEFAKAIGEE